MAFVGSLAPGRFSRLYCHAVYVKSKPLTKTQGLVGGGPPHSPPTPPPPPSTPPPLKENSALPPSDMPRVPAALHRAPTWAVLYPVQICTYARTHVYAYTYSPHPVDLTRSCGVHHALLPRGRLCWAGHFLGDKLFFLLLG